MINFSFNLLEKSGLLERAYILISNFVNKNVLKRYTLKTELVSDAFRAIDGFWLKHGQTEWYGESEVRVIVGSVVESLRDNELSAGEVRVLVNYITSKWKPEIAQSKSVLEPASLLPNSVEINALRAVEMFKQLPSGRIDPAYFVALLSRTIAENLPDNVFINNLLKSIGLK